jgi:hypothetical protein
VATVPIDRMVPDVPMTRSKPLRRSCVRSGLIWLADCTVQLALVASTERVRGHEPFGQADHAEFEAARELRLPGRRRVISTLPPPTSITTVGFGVSTPYTAAIVNEPRFFGAGDDRGRNARGLRSMRERISPPFSASAGRAGRRRENLIDLMRRGESLEFRERLKRRAHRLARQRSCRRARRRRAYHLFFAVDDLEREVRTDLDDDHMYRSWCPISIAARQHGGMQRMRRYTSEAPPDRSALPSGVPSIVEGRARRPRS